MNIEQSALFEHRFWLQILGDHARFIHDSLAPKEKEEIERSSMFIQIFDRLLCVAREPLSLEAIHNLNHMAYRHTMELRQFKLHLLRRLLCGEIAVHLPPTFFNHMVNELDEYIQVLTFLRSDQIPVFSAVHHHLLWLSDASGHASAILSNLDEVEFELSKKTKHFEKKFNHFYLKAIQIAGYLRTQLEDFPALRRFNEQVDLEMGLFKSFLIELEEMKLTNVLLGTLMPLMADHMAREECYYLTKLSQVSHVSAPDCDPARPRVTAGS